MSKINRSEIYDKNLNFLIGSGASFGFLPTLALGMKIDGTEKPHSFETLATKFDDDEDIKALLFSWYVKNVIEPAASFEMEMDFLFTAKQAGVIENYETFLTSVISLLLKRPNHSRANIFTTNYDGLVAHVAEKMLQTGRVDFVVNDGGSGFIKRVLDTKTFGRFYQDQGVFERHAKNVPQINLIQLHGSVYWYKNEHNIEISYDKTRSGNRIGSVPVRQFQEFDALLGDSGKSDADVSSLIIGQDEIANTKFWDAYKQLPVVNPTKSKFYETVFEEHYYQMLRLLSYELEKPNTVFIAFGFSFADEHILNLVKRSLSNPTLKLFVCCFNSCTEKDLLEKFRGFDSVEFVTVDGDLDFTAFNEQVFSVTSAIGAAGV